jgi:segregation and condensation protein B
MSDGSAPDGVGAAGAAGGGDVAAAVHALLFASAEPLSLDRLAALAHATREAVRSALRRIAGFYGAVGGGGGFAAGAPGGVQLREVAGGWQLTTCPEQAEVVASLGRSRPQPVSPAALETLAIVAYRQPVTRAEVEQIRGVGVDGVMSTLIDRDLVREVGRKQAPGRPTLYGTTEEFLRYFGLRSLRDLPQPADEGGEAEAGRGGRDAG